MVTAFWIFLKSPMTTWSYASCSDEPEPFKVAGWSFVTFVDFAACAVPTAKTGSASAARKSPQPRTNERRILVFPPGTMGVMPGS